MEQKLSLGAHMHNDMLKKIEHSEKIRKNADSSFKNNNLNEAVRLYELSIKINSNNAKALNNFAALSEELGEVSKAECLYKLACNLPENTVFEKLKFHQNLALIQEKSGKINAALWTYQLAAELEGFTKNTIAFNYLDLLQVINFTSFDVGIFASLTSLFNTEGLDKDALAQVYFSQLALKLEKAKYTEKDYAILALDIIESEPITLKLLSSNLVSNYVIEEAITKIRAELVGSMLGNNYNKTHRFFLAALRKQCKLNNFIYHVSEEELLKVDVLKEKISNLSPMIQIDAQLILESYQSSGAKKSCCTDGLVRRSKKKETTLSGLLKSKKLIQSFYESNPYPLWSSRPKHSESTLEQLFKALNLKQLPPGNNILVAGCGTGRHAIQLALTYPRARVIGLDVSQASLQYATKKRDEYKIRNLELIHGDLNNILSLNMGFSLIECVGVLHHLQDPMKGCRAILSALEDGGIAKIGLYSKRARTPIVNLASLASESEILYVPGNLERIRKLAIQNYKHKRIDEIVNSRDFFSRSGCMDLLFNPLEKTFTIRDIQSLIQDLECEFAGFENGGQKKSPAFRRFNEQTDMDIFFDAWESFEALNQNFFSEMYLFWLKPKRK